MLRLLGSMTHEEEDENGPIRIYPGRSIGQTFIEDGIESDEEADCVEFPSKRFDEENRTFVKRPVKGVRKVGDLHQAEVKNTFSLSWEILRRVHSRKFSSDVIFSPGVVMGNIILRYPVVSFRGKSLCNEIKGIVA